MTARPVCLLDQQSSNVARLDVELRGDHFEGTIHLDAVPPDLWQLFAEFEELVEGQVFSLLDEIEDRVEAARLRVLFDDGTVTAVTDLQVYPTTCAVSFKTRQPVLPIVNGIIGARQDELLSREGSIHPMTEGQGTT